MDMYPSSKPEHPGLASGVRTAVLVVVLGTVAALADHAYFVAPHSAPRPAVMEAPAEPTIGRAEGVTLPADLRPTQADAATSTPTF